MARSASVGTGHQVRSRRCRVDVFGEGFETRQGRAYVYACDAAVETALYPIRTSSVLGMRRGEEGGGVVESVLASQGENDGTCY